MQSAKTKTSRSATTATKPSYQPASIARVQRSTQAHAIQASRVSKPSDPAEKEADTTAAKVMRMSMPDSSVSMVGKSGQGVFRQIKPDDKQETAVQKKEGEEKPEDTVSKKEEENEEAVQAKEDEKTEEPIQRAEEKEETAQTKAEDEKREENVQSKEEEEEAQTKQAEKLDETPQRKEEEEEAAQAKESEKEEPIQTKAAPDKEENIQRRANGESQAKSNVFADIRSSMAGGTPLPLSVRRFMEPRFNADFSKVRIHTDENSEKLNKKVNAQAFAIKNHVFFGKGKYQPDSSQGKELIAHELTHTIQQGASPQRPDVQRKESASVSQTSAPQVQRLGISDALDYFADKANYIPGFRMFTIVLGINPINMSRVDRSAANILRALIEFIPGASLFTQALDNHGVFNKVSAWAEAKIKALAMTGSAIRDAIDRFLDSLSWTDIFDLGGVWSRAKRILTEPITRLINFAKGIVTDLLNFIKDAILKPLASLAEGTRGWDLLLGVLGFNPITGDAVDRTPDLLIGGFMKLIGQEEIWNNLKKANAVERAWAWFQGAMMALFSFVAEIPSLFIAALKSLEIMDLVLVSNAFIKVGKVFKGFVGRFVSWAGTTIWNLLEIIFAVVAPGVLPYLKKAGGAFRSILQNPIGFVGNLVRAGKLGFQMFAARIGKHLKTALIDWLTGSLGSAGVYIPASFEIKEIIKFVLSVLGVTWQNVRKKLVKAVGEPAVKAMETGFKLVVTLVREGPAALWKQIKQMLTNLKQIVVEGIMNWVVTKVVQQAVIKIVSMLNPAGAIIQAIIAIYNTITFFIERLSQIGRVVGAFINSIAAIASGAIGGAAARVERTLAGMLSIAIGFLAKFAGLGKVSDAIIKIIDRIRAPIDKAMDKAIAWIVAQARKLGRFVAQAGVPQDPNKRLQLASKAAIAAAKALKGKATKPLLKGALAAIKMRYAMTELEPYEKAGTWWVKAVVNPTKHVSTGVSSSASDGVPDKRFLPGSIDVRRHLFINGSGFGSIKKQVKTKTLEKVRDKVRVIRDPQTKSAAKSQHWSWLVNKGLVPPSADRDKYTVAKVNAASYDVDHIKPLAKHWVQTGFNSGDGARQSIAGSESNLQLLLSSINKSKGGDGYTYAQKRWVGPTFSSDYNSSPSGGKKIKGQYFRDDKGKALK